MVIDHCVSAISCIFFAMLCSFLIFFLISHMIKLKRLVFWYLALLAITILLLRINHVVSLIYQFRYQISSAWSRVIWIVRQADNVLYFMAFDGSFRLLPCHHRLKCRLLKCFLTLTLLASHLIIESSRFLFVGVLHRRRMGHACWRRRERIHRWCRTLWTLWLDFIHESRILSSICFWFHLL